MDRLIELDADLGDYLVELDEKYGYDKKTGKSLNPAHKKKKLKNEDVEDILEKSKYRNPYVQSVAGGFTGGHNPIAYVDGGRLRSRGVKRPTGAGQARRRQEKGMTPYRSTARGRRAYDKGRPLSEGSVKAIESERAYKARRKAAKQKD